MATLIETFTAYGSLSEQEKAVFRAAALPPASNGVANVLWVLTFGVLGLVVVGGGLLALDATGSDETALYGFVGIALGGFAGLLAPSPVATSG
jgi:hypothetical protein